MKIRAKVKHLVYASGLLGLFLFCGFCVGLPGHEQKQAAAETKEQILQAIRLAKPDDQLKLIAEKLLKEDSGDLTRVYDVYIGPGQIMYSGSAAEVETKPEFSLKEKVPYLEQYVQAGNSEPEIATAAKLLAYYYEGAGQWQKAVQTLADAGKRMKTHRYGYAGRELLFMQARLVAEHKQYDELLRLTWELLRASDSSNLNTRIADLLAKYAALEGDAPAVLKQIQAELEREKKQIIKENRTQIQTDQLETIQEQVQKLISGGKKAVTDVSGTIAKSNGKPVAYAGIFLRRQNDLNHSMTDYEPYQTMTNERGEYSFKGIPPGSYKLYLGLNLGQISGWTWPSSSDDGWIDLKGQRQWEENIVFRPLMELKSPVNDEIIKDNKLTFEWKPVEGAAYYNLNMGMKLHSGSSSRQIRQGIATTRIEVPTEELYYELSNVAAYSNGKEKMKLDPLSLLGFANTDNQFSWSVEAYSADGRLLTRSDGYRLGSDLTGQIPLFYLKERTMTIADKTLLQGDLEKAEAMYKADYQHNPADAHSLHMMFTLLEGKTSLLGGGRADKVEKKSLEAKQEELLKQLITLRPTAAYYDWFVYYYRNRADWKEYNRYYALAESMSQSKDHSYSDGAHAVALMKQGKVEAAKTYFQQSLDRDKSHRFIGAYLALTMYLGSSLDQAAALAAKYPDRMMYNTSLNWEELLLEMRRESAGNPDYRAVLQGKLERYVQGKNQELNRWQPAPESEGTAMKKFMDALEQVG
jgi:hypothetical protein